MQPQREIAEMLRRARRGAETRDDRSVDDIGADARRARLLRGDRTTRLEIRGRVAADIDPEIDFALPVGAVGLRRREIAAVSEFARSRQLVVRPVGLQRETRFAAQHPGAGGGRGQAVRIGIIADVGFDIGRQTQATNADAHGRVGVGFHLRLLPGRDGLRHGDCRGRLLRVLPGTGGLHGLLAGLRRCRIGNEPGKRLTRAT